MRAYVLASVVALLAGCSPLVNKCADQTVFVEVTLDEASRQADGLAIDVTVDNGTPQHSDLPHAAGKAAGGIVVEFPGGYPVGKSLAITIVAKTSGATVGTGTATGTLTAGCDQLAVDVKANGVPIDMTIPDGADLAGAPDASTDTALGDLANADLTDETADLSVPPGADLSPVVDLTPPRDLTATPTVTGVDTNKANGTYGAGTTIDIIVNFTAPVTVTGSPTLQVNIPSGSGPIVATYQSGSGTAALVFRYVVLAGHESAKLDYTGTSALSADGGTITGGGVDAALFLPMAGAAGSLAATHNIVINTAVLQFQYGSGNPPMADSFGTTNSNPSHVYKLMNAGGGPTGAITASLATSQPTYWSKDSDQCNGQSLSTGQSCLINVAFLAGVQDQNAGTATATLTATAPRGGSSSHSLTGTAAYTWTPSANYGTQYGASSTATATTTTAPSGSCPTQNAYQIVEGGSSPGGLQTVFVRDTGCDGMCGTNWCYHNVSPGGLRACDGSMSWDYIFGSGGGIFGTSVTCFPAGTAATVYTRVTNTPAPPSLAIAGECETSETKVVRDYRCR